jgi:hypothetical protein
MQIRLGFACQTSYKQYQNQCSSDRLTRILEERKISSVREIKNQCLTPCTTILYTRKTWHIPVVHISSQRTWETPPPCCLRSDHLGIRKPTLLCYIVSFVHGEPTLGRRLRLYFCRVRSQKSWEFRASHQLCMPLYVHTTIWGGCTHDDMGSLTAVSV